MIHRSGENLPPVRAEGRGIDNRGMLYLEERFSARDAPDRSDVVSVRGEETLIIRAEGDGIDPILVRERLREWLPAFDVPDFDLPGVNRVVHESRGNPLAVSAEADCDPETVIILEMFFDLA